jgi:hypothetical protein
MDIAIIHHQLTLQILNCQVMSVVCECLNRIDCEVGMRSKTSSLVAVNMRARVAEDGGWRGEKGGAKGKLVRHGSAGTKEPCLVACERGNVSFQGVNVVVFLPHVVASGGIPHDGEHFIGGLCHLWKGSVKTV